MIIFGCVRNMKRASEFLSAAGFPVWERGKKEAIRHMGVKNRIHSQPSKIHLCVASTNLQISPAHPRVRISSVFLNCILKDSIFIPQEDIPRMRGSINGKLPTNVFSFLSRGGCNFGKEMVISSFPSWV